MRKRFSLIIASAVVVFVSPLVRAEGSLTDTELQAIQASCVGAQIALQQVQTSEKGARTNRGRIYDSVGKLMVNLNSRVVQNKLDAPQLISVVSDYQKALDEFRSDFNPYDDALKGLIKMDCREQPTTFNDQLNETKLKRAKLNADVIALDNLLDKYQSGLDALESKVGGIK